MSRALLLLMTLALLGGGIWYWWNSQSTPLPTLHITTPTGGEEWQPGEEHVISWSTHGIPATDYISITIQRLPPPPLQTEGQEFDPIIFTNLPNTGSTTWKISPMYPSGTYVLGIQAYATLPITQGEVTAESVPFTLTHPTLSGDLYPLYSGSSWNGRAGRQRGPRSARSSRAPARAPGGATR